jgi:hypothetical protein
MRLRTLAVGLDAGVDPGEAVVSTKPGHLIVADKTCTSTKVVPIGWKRPLLDVASANLLNRPDVGYKVHAILGVSMDQRDMAMDRR